MEVTGWRVGAVVGGRIVMREDETVGDPAGEPIRFQETLPKEDD